MNAALWVAAWIVVGAVVVIVVAVGVVVGVVVAVRTDITTTATQLLFAAQAKLVRLQCDMHGMVAENQTRAARGETPAYSEEAFVALSRDAFDGPRGINELMNTALDIGPNGVVVYGQGRKKEKGEPC
jgi:hypothetical protein